MVEPARLMERRDIAMSLQDMMFSMLVCLKGRTGSAAALFRAELVARPLHLLIMQPVIPG